MCCLSFFSSIKRRILRPNERKIFQTSRRDFKVSHTIIVRYMRISEREVRGKNEIETRPRRKICKYHLLVMLKRNFTALPTASISCVNLSGVNGLSYNSHTLAFTSQFLHSRDTASYHIYKKLR